MKRRKNSNEVSGLREAHSLAATALRAGAFLLLGAGLAFGAPPEEECSVPAEVREVAPGAFVRQGVTALPNAGNGGAIANIGFIIGDSAVAVIDTGGSLCDGLRLRAAIRSRTDLPIAAVINTHVHPDHIFGNAAFSEDGAGIVGHRNLPRALSERAEHYLRSYGGQIGPAAMEGTRALAPKRLVEGRLDIDLGGRTLIVEAQPAAHTDADLTVFDEASGILWTGDLVFLDHIPVLDGSLRGWLAVTAKLARHPARRIVPGHGPAIAPWPEAGETQRRYLERLAADLKAAIGRGQGIAEAASSAASSESAAWALFGDFNSRNATAGFAELEWD